MFVFSYRYRYHTKKSFSALIYFTQYGTEVNILKSDVAAEPHRSAFILSPRFESVFVIESESMCLNLQKIL